MNQIRQIARGLGFRVEMDNIGIIGFTLGLYRDNGKENGNYPLGFRTRILDSLLCIDELKGYSQNSTCRFFCSLAAEYTLGTDPLQDYSTLCDVIFRGVFCITVYCRPQARRTDGNYRDYIIGIIGFTLGLYRDNGKENGNYPLGFRTRTSKRADTGGRTRRL